jgi:amino-acid N-acetyltransferase
MTHIRKARIKDIDEIHSLISAYSKKGFMLYRPTIEISAKIRDYFVAESDGKVVGCISLRIWTKDVAEICALAVSQEHQGKGIAKMLISECIKEAQELGLAEVIALTYLEKLFGGFGFKKTDSVPEIMYTERTVNMDKAYSLKL